TLNDSTVRRTDSLVVHPLKTTTYRLIAAGSVHDTSSIVITAVPLDQINRALLRPVSVSATSRNPALANPQSFVDGDTATVWESGASDGQWLDCDLGQNFLVRKVIVRWGGIYATAWRLRLSSDDNTFSDIRSATGGAGGTTVIDSLNHDGSYVRLMLDTRSSTSAGFEVRELEVYGVSQPLSVSGSGPGIPERYALLQNYPNPFNPSTTISFALPVRSQVTISIYNLLGQRVAEIINSELETGYHAVRWNAGAASGVYFCRMEAVPSGTPGRAFQQTMKLMVLR
ncbi:MAG TPA: discoidin domain-containing protein, partial [Bacteroidota bacterium]